MFDYCMYMYMSLHQRNYCGNDQYLVNVHVQKSSYVIQDDLALLIVGDSVTAPELFL